MTSSRARPASQRRALAAAAWLLAIAVVAPPSVAQQEGPIRLFPTLPSETPAQAEPPEESWEPEQASDPEFREPDADDAPHGSFRVEGLEAPGVDSIGLSAPGTGFDPAIWQGSSGDVVRALLGSLPVVTENPRLREMIRRLLVTGTPLGAAEPGRLLETRVERLLAMGAFDDATALIEQLPSGGSDSTLARLAVDAALLAGDRESACGRAAAIAPSSSAPYWGKLTVYCRLAEGDRSGADLALGLLREAGQTDDRAFYDLAAATAGEGAVPTEGLSDLSALEIAMLRLAEQRVPAAALEGASPAVLAVVARDPELAGERRLEIAERAFLGGVLPASQVADAYASEPAAEEGEALQRVREAWGPAARAAAYRWLQAEEEVPAAAELLDALWRAARGPERFLVSEVYAEWYQALPADGALLWAAPSIARALLAGDRPVPAARWFSLLQDGVGEGTRTRGAAASLAPLFALAGFGGGSAVPRMDAQAVEAWRLATPDAEEHSERLLALIDGVAPGLPAGIWHDLLQPPLQRQAAVPATALWRGLHAAITGERRGETVLYALHLLGGAPGEAYPEAVVESLRAMRAMGLDREARGVAVATAIAEGL